MLRGVVGVPQLGGHEEIGPGADPRLKGTSNAFSNLGVGGFLVWGLGLKLKSGGQRAILKSHGLGLRLKSHRPGSGLNSGNLSSSLKSRVQGRV